MQNIMWIDGQYAIENDVKIPVFSQTLHYGFGVYEGIRSYETTKGPAIFRLQDHIDRLFESADILKIKIPFTKQELLLAHHTLLEKNNFANAYLRPVVFMGDEYPGLHTLKSSVHVMIAVIAWNHFFVSAHTAQHGICIKTSTYRRPSLNNHLNHAKANGLYIISMLANNEAHAENYDDALLLDQQGFVAECSGANIFFIKNNVLYTPRPDYILNGITRKTIIHLAKVENIQVIEKNISLEELYSADEVFLTGTASEVLPVTSVDSCVISTGEIGMLTQQLQAQYRNIVTGHDEKFGQWLSYGLNKEVCYER